MKYTCFLIAVFYLVIIGHNLKAQAPDFTWAHKATGLNTYGEEGRYRAKGTDVTTDPDGNTYVVGSFSNTKQLGSNILVCGSSGTNLYIAKYDASGTLLWAKKDGGKGNVSGAAIVVDGLGNILVAGDFSGTPTFGDSSTLAGSGNKHVYINYLAKYDSSGNLVWVQSREGLRGGDKMTVDSAGNIYITGNFRGTVTFGEFSLTSISSSGNIYLAKCDASGKVLWARSSGESSVTNGVQVSHTYDIALDSLDNILVTGYFFGTAVFGNTTLMSSGYSDVFIAKYDTAGTALWAQRGGGTFTDISYGISTDGLGNIYITGEYTKVASFGNKVISNYNSDIRDVFVAKYNAEGVVQWVWKAGTNGIAWGITTDKTGKIYVTGYFIGIAIFDNTVLTSVGSSKDAFIAKFDPSGEVLWAQKAGESNADDGVGIAVDGNGNAYMTGYFETRDSESRIQDDFLAKYDISGNMEWTQNAVITSPDDMGKSIATDAMGNVYVTGSFKTGIAFGDTILNGSHFIAKYNPSGEIQWVQRIGGIGNGIAVDRLGNVYVAGTFSNIATFGGITLRSNGFEDIFIAKLDSSGNFLWAHNAGGESSSGGKNAISGDGGMALAVDDNSNVYITGYFQGNAIFENVTLTSAGYTDIFVAKYNASGALQWAKRAGGACICGNRIPSDAGYGIALDASGNIFVTGTFMSSASFDHVTFTNKSGFFIAKYTPSGDLSWIKTGEVALSASQPFLNGGIAVDDSGNAYIIGSFYNEIIFDNIILKSSRSSTDVFIAKFNGTGNLQWVKDIGMPTSSDRKAIAVDGSGNSLVAGTVVIDQSHRDAIISRFDSSGNLQWTRQFGGLGNDAANGVALDKEGNAYITGFFEGEVSFGNTTLLTSGREYFVAKIAGIGSGPTAVPMKPAADSGLLKVYPNPTHGTREVIVQLNSLSYNVQVEVEVYSLTGQKIVAQQYSYTSGSFEQKLEIGSLAKGMYMVLLKAGSEVFRSKLLVE